MKDRRARLLGSGTRAGGVAVGKAVAAASMLALLLAAPAAGVRGEELSEQKQVLEPVVPDKARSPEIPPPLDWRDGIRVQMEGQFVPDADLSGSEVSLVRGVGRARLRAPITERTRLQLTGTIAPSHYDVKDSDELFSDCPTCPEPKDFQEVSLVLIGGYLLNQDKHLIRPGERWALLGGADVRARWETGAFNDSITGGGSLGLGYAIPDRLLLGLGVQVESKLNGGVSVRPDARFRWQITDELRLRDRGLGLQLGYRPGGRFEYSVSGYRMSETFLLKESGAPKDLTFEDRRTIVTGGLEWRAYGHLRVRAEAGAVVERRLRFESDGDELDTVSGDPSPYIGLRLELRP